MSVEQSICEDIMRGAAAADSEALRGAIGPMVPGVVKIIEEYRGCDDAPVAAAIAAARYLLPGAAHIEWYVMQTPIRGRCAFDVAFDSAIWPPDLPTISPFRLVGAHLMLRFPVAADMADAYMNFRQSMSRESVDNIYIREAIWVAAYDATNPNRAAAQAAASAIAARFFFRGGAGVKKRKANSDCVHGAAGGAGGRDALRS